MVQRRRLKKRGARAVARVKANRANVPTVRAIVKKEMDKQEEIKQYYLNAGINTATFINDSVYTFAPTQVLGQGVGENHRVGNSIYLKNILFRMSMTGALASLNGRLRVIALWTDKQYLLNTGTWSGTNAGVLFSDIFFGPNIRNVNAIKNNKLDCRVIYDKVLSVTSGSTSIQKGMIDVNLKINKKVTYLANSSFFKDKQLYVVVIPDIPAVNSGTLSAWTFWSELLVTFKDA